MKRNIIKDIGHHIIAILIITVVSQTRAFADRPGWEKEDVNWRLGSSAARSVKYPESRPVITAGRRGIQRATKKVLSLEALSTISLNKTRQKASLFTNVIDSPAIDGFVPWIAVSITNARSEPLELDAVTQYSITGNFLTGSPESDYAIGIYDTGASAHVIGYGAASRAGLYSAGKVTSNTSIVSGVTGEMEVRISHPTGIFIDGIGAIGPDGLLTDRTGMMGQSNTAIAVGQGFEPVDLPTAIGTPLSVYFTTAFDNANPVTVSRDGNEYTSPDIRIYPQDDPEIPAYTNKIPLELRPLGGISVQYVFSFEDLDFLPTSPSVIIGNASQSVFFVASVDMYEEGHSAIDKTRFMFDTGAQITVIGSRIAARLAINPAQPEFEVEIQGVTGDVNTFPGFYIDAVDIPSLGEWLSFTNVPVVLLDVPSPEGGTVDGIIGMNLFTDLNFVLRGGGLFLQDDPAVEYQPLPVVGDIAPGEGDGFVDWLDFAAIADAWLATPAAGNWNAKADLSPDSMIDFRDFAILAGNWE